MTTISIQSNSHPGTVIRIPQEICGIICQYAAPSKHLYVLCGISRAFREEAERILYSSVLLRDNTKLRTFCITVIRHPYLVRGMRKLVLMMIPLQSIDPDDLSRLVKMLHLSTNLQDLRVQCQDRNALPSAMHNWILEGHAFKLTTFMNSYFLQPRLKTFLESQSTLRTLRMPWTTSVGLSGTAIPKLKNLDCSVYIVQELIEASSASQIMPERLSVALVYSRDLWDMETFFRGMGTRFGGTLKCLHISGHICNAWRGSDLAMIIACVATHLPNIKFLQIDDYTKEKRYQKPPLFTGFTQIETLILAPPLLCSDDRRTSPDTTSWYQLQTDAGRLSVALKVMDVLPTLKRLVFKLFIDSFRYEYIRTSSAVLDSAKVRGENMDEWLKVKL